MVNRKDRIEPTSHCEGAQSATAAIRTNKVGLSRIRTVLELFSLVHNSVELPRSLSFARNDKRVAFTCLVKHFRSNPLHALLRSRIARFSQTKFCFAHSYGACFAAINGHATAKPLTSALCRKAAFTLAETMIVVAILGVIAVLTVPNLVNKNIERTNRTKVKKAMAAYEQALSNMVVGNQLKNDDDIDTLNDATCSKTSNYFKISEGSGCIFKTADNVWWNITDVKNPIISFKREDLTDDNAKDANTTKAFYLIGRIDNNGILRINDNDYEQKNGSLKNKAAMIKLWAFSENSKISPSEMFTMCKAAEAPTCIVNGVTYTLTHIASFTKNIHIWDRENNKQINIQSTIDDGNYYVAGLKITADDANNLTGSICSNCTKDYHQAAIRQCESQSAHLANMAEVTSLYNAGTLPNLGWIRVAEEDRQNFSWVVKTDNPQLQFGNGYGSSHKGNGSHAVCIAN